MYKESDIIDLETVSEDDCDTCATHEAAYKFFKNKLREAFKEKWNEDTLDFCNSNQIFSEEEMIGKAVLCPVCNKPMTKGYSGYENNVVITWDNGTNPDGEVGYYPIYECEHCEKPYALIPTQVHYNANHDIFYSGGKCFLNYDDEELLKSKVKDKMLQSIEQYTRRIKDGETSLDSWNLNYWLQGDIEHAIAEFLYEAGYKK